MRALEKELESVSRENEKLKTIIDSIQSGYKKLQAQTMKIEREKNLDQSCSTCILEVEPLKPNSYRVLVKTDPNDSTLVSSHFTLLVSAFSSEFNSLYVN